MAQAAGDLPLGLAGLWERWEKHGEPVESRTILTTDANGLMRPINGRVPVVVPPDQYGLWLAPHCQDGKRPAKLPRPYPPKDMLAYRVSALVSDPRDDVPRCAEATW